MAGNKSAGEARVERLTWGLLVLIFAALYLLSDNLVQALPNWLVPMAGAVVLLGSGAYQYARKWRVSPITWIAGMLLLFLAIIGNYILPGRSFIIESLFITLIVIIFGTFSGET